MLGASAAERERIVAERARGRRVFYCGPAVLRGESAGDRISFDDSVMYVHFYRWLREISADSVLVLEEPLRGTERSTLPLNCLRHYAAQAGETIVFSYLPIVEGPEDFMVLFDLATKSRWRKATLAEAPLSEVEIVSLGPRSVHFTPRVVAVDDKTSARVAKKKRELIDKIGTADPHTIPRRLYQETGLVRFAAVTGTETPLVGRNNRFGLTHLRSFRDADTAPRVVFELCHEHTVFNAWLSGTRQTEVEVLVADAKIDRWYFDRYVRWSRALAETYQAVLP